MVFDSNFRILRSIVPDPQNPDDEITEDFKVYINMIFSETTDFRAISPCIGSFEGVGDGCIWAVWPRWDVHLR
jgi:hypothetical protein